MKLLQYKGIAGHPQHGFGYKADPIGHRYNGFWLHPGASLVTLPKETNNRIYLPPRWNQAQTGSCTGHGMSAVVTMTFAAQQKPLASPAAPRPAYMLGRAVDRPSISTPLVDGGAQPNSLVRAYGVWGCLLESEVDGGRTASSPDYGSFLEAHVNDDPKLGELERGAKRIIVGFNAITEQQQATTLQVRQAHASGHGVGVAVDAGNDKFQSAQKGKVLTYCGPNPDHWVMLADYRTTLAGTFEYLLDNSWGHDWADDGQVWVDEDFVARGCFNLLACNIAV